MYLHTCAYKYEADKSRIMTKVTNNMTVCFMQQDVNKYKYIYIERVNFVFGYNHAYFFFLLFLEQKNNFKIFSFFNKVINSHLSHSSPHAKQYVSNKKNVTYDDEPK